MRAMPPSENDYADWIGEAYDAFSDAIFRHCLFRIRCREHALEIMQETFIRVLEYRRKGNVIDNVRAFLYRTANNLIIDEVRKAKHRPQTSLEALQEEGFDPGNDNDARAMHHAIDVKIVMQTLEKIDQPYRDMLIMRFVDNLNPAEISELTGESANVVSVRIHRGMKMLRTLLAHGND